MRIKTKLYLSSFISIILITALIIVMIITSSKVAKKNEQRAASRQTLQAVSELDILTYEYLLHHEKRAEQQWDLRYASLGKSLAALVNSEGTASPLIKDYKIIKNSFSELKVNHIKHDRLIETAAPQKELDAAIAIENRLMAQLLITSQSMISKASQLAEKNVSDMLSTQVFGDRSTLVLGLILLLNGIIVALAITKTIAKTLHELHVGTDRVGQGNLNYKIDIQSKDEIGQVARTFNKMTTNLKSIIASKTDLEREIKQRKKAENQMNEVIRVTGAGYYEHAVDNSSGLVSERFAEILGYKLEELPRYPEFAKWLDKHIYREDSDEFITQVRDFHLGKMMRFDHEYRILAKNNTWRWLHFISTSLRKDAKGHPLYVAGLVFDITDQKNTEEALKKSETSFRAVAETAKDAIVSANTNGKIIHFNKGAELTFGYTAADALNKPITILMPQRFHKDHLHGFTRFLTSHKPHIIGKTIELTGIKKNGSEFPIELSVANWKVEDEGYFTAIIRDITERKNLEQRKDDFITIAGHELRTPVSAIKLMNQILQELLADNPQALKYLKKIEHQSSIQATLINDLLSVSKIQTGKLEIHKKSFDLQDLIKETIEDMQETTREHKLVIKGKIYGKIFSDKEKIEQVLTNFCSNAIKFSPKGGEIIISLKESKKDVVIGVTDQGIGIPKEHHHGIFKRFYRVYGTGDKSYPGLGMGLYISYHIIKLLNGRMWFESAPGKGSTFYFSLPFQV